MKADSFLYYYSTFPRLSPSSALNHYLTSSSKREVPKVIDHDNKPFTLSAEGVLYSEKSNDKKYSTGYLGKVVSSLISSYAV